MTRGEMMLALLVPVLWGLNFPASVFILAHYPPMLGAAIRFLLIAVPTVLLVPRPGVGLGWLLGTGLGIGFFQFAFLYAGLAAGMPAGLASLVLQASAPLTVALAVVLLGERLTAPRVAGLALAMLGLAVIGTVRAQAVSWWPVALTMLAAVSWAGGNICIRKAQAARPLHLALWMTVVPPLPLLALSALTEADRVGPALAGALTPAALPANLALAFSAFGASVVGFGVWNRLLTRHPAAVIAPWSMLVPVVGILSSWLILSETPRLVELAGGALILAGVLVINPPRGRVTKGSAGSAAPRTSPRGRR